MKIEGNVTAEKAAAYYNELKTCADDEVEFCFKYSLT